MASTVLPAVAEFIDWSILLVFILMIYYGVKALLYQSQEELNEEDKNRNSAVKNIKGMLDKSTRKKKVQYPKKLLVDSIKESEDLEAACSEEASAKNLKEIKHIVSELKTHLKHLVHDLRRMTREEDGHYASVASEMTKHAAVAYRLTNGLRVPKKHDDADYTSKIDAMKDRLTGSTGIIYVLGSVFNDLNKFIETHEDEMEDYASQLQSRRA